MITDQMMLDMRRTIDVMSKKRDFQGILRLSSETVSAAREETG